jgi:hypothetical protein
MTARATSLALRLGSLHGVVTRGPTPPRGEVGRPCKEPAAQMCLRFGRTKVTTDRNGRYRVKLPPGRYAVRTCATSTIGRGFEPSTVRVVANRDRRVDLFVDTGIR